MTTRPDRSAEILEQAPATTDIQPEPPRPRLPRRLSCTLIEAETYRELSCDLQHGSAGIEIDGRPVEAAIANQLGCLVVTSKPAAAKLSRAGFIVATSNAEAFANLWQRGIDPAEATRPMLIALDGGTMPISWTEDLSALEFRGRRMTWRDLEALLGVVIAPLAAEQLDRLQDLGFGFVTSLEEADERIDALHHRERKPRRFARLAQTAVLSAPKPMPPAIAAAQPKSIAIPSLLDNHDMQANEADDDNQQAEQGATTSQPRPRRTRENRHPCQGLTRADTRCGRASVPGENRCRLHFDASAEADPAAPKVAMFAAIRAGRGVDEAIEAAGLSRGSLYQRRHNDPDFAAAWDLAVSEAPSGQGRGAKHRRIQESSSSTPAAETPTAAAIAHEWAAPFFAGLRDGLSVAKSAELAGVDLVEAYRRREEDEPFAATWDKARATGRQRRADQLEDRAFEAAIGQAPEFSLQRGEAQIVFRPARSA